MNGLPGTDELRALIREVLRDALAAGYLKSTSARYPGRPIHAERNNSERGAGALPAAPPSEIPAGTIHQGGPADNSSGSSDLVDATSAASRASAGRSTTSAVSSGGAAARHVRLATDEDLREFVLTVVRLADNPARRRDLLTGRLRFTLTGSPGGHASPPGGHAGAETFRIEAGAVTERAVQAAAKAGERLVLGRRAVLTPLARDRALTLGVPIERER
jgi:acetylornithine deacetylase/succinyl-diaminopimelate desuccinylase-like protein